MEIISFLVLFCIFILCAVYFIYKDKKNIIQPHSFYTVNQFILLSLIPFIQFFFVKIFEDTEGILFTNSLIAISYVFFSLGFFVKKRKSVVILNSFIKHFDIKNIPEITLTIHILIMSFIALLLFIYLTEKSGLGFLSWIINPRIGYQFYRKGLGFFYVLSLAILNFVFLYLLFFKIRKINKLILSTILFVFIFYFFGNKANILFTIFLSIVFYNFFIKKIKLRTIIPAFLILSSIFFISFKLYRPKQSNVPLFTEILSYVGYYNEGRKFFSDFEKDFHFAYGKEYVNSLWMYVPRALYKNKPYSYGLVKYVVEHYYPGGGERGDTPAFGGPVEEYLNFGIIGVVLIGFLRGYFSSLFYHYFLVHRNFVGFVLLSNLMGFSIFPVMQWPAYKVLWYLINFILLFFHKQLISGSSYIRQRSVRLKDSEASRLDRFSDLDSALK